MHYISKVCCCAITPLILGCQPLGQLRSGGIGVEGDQVFDLYVSLSRNTPSSDCIPIISKHLREIKDELLIQGDQIYFASGTSLHQDLQQFLLIKNGSGAYIKNLNGAMSDIKITADQFKEIWRQFDFSPSAVIDGHSPGHVNCYIAVRNFNGELKLFSSPSRLSVNGGIHNQAMEIGELIDDAAG